MKNAVKNGLLALVVTVSFAACKGKGSANVDSVSTDTSSSTHVTDTIKKDTNSMTPDSLKKDTSVHTTTTTTTTTTTETKHKKK
ncbi:hypothetical protein ACFS5N_02650 [Mucilaginibacter ximonensis]|uniref:Uncharacterized protein n=1 Tax=Mucilaginibacter ximonensis TaxID=538021 RepID=A0ABW5Y9A0_9SPHI